MSVQPAAVGALGMVLFGLGNAGIAGGVVVLSIGTRTSRQTESPSELLARVMATVRCPAVLAGAAGGRAAG